MNAQNEKAAQAAGGQAGARQQNPAVSRIVEKALEELARWEEERPKRERGRMLFYCPVCTSAYSVSYSTYKRRGAPHCLRCGVEMVRYDEDAFAKRRRELAENAKKIMTKLVDIFAKAAEIYGRTLLRWSLHDGYITFRLDELDPTEFEYDFAHNVVRARFYYFDVPRYREAADYMAEVRRLGLRLELQIYPPHADQMLLPEGAKYDVESGHYIVAP